MTNEEFQRLVLEKLTSLENGQKEILSEIKNLKDADQSIIELIQESHRDLDKKIDSILTTQTTQGESINILALRQLQTESELSVLKKAK